MPFACAHRGDSSRYRENTIEAIRSAIENGADVVEIDVRLSSDKEVIVIHDSTLERMWGVPKEVTELSWAEISSIRTDSYRIPLLSEVLELFKGNPTLLMIDMEVTDPAIAALEVVKASQMPLNQVTWCGNTEAMRLIRRASSEARIWMAWDRLELPTDGQLAELKPEFLNFHYSVLDAKRVAEAHKLGCKVSAWTVQEHTTMRWAAAIGIDSITTDYLSVLKGVIAERPSLDSDGPKALSIGTREMERIEQVAIQLGKFAVLVTTNFEPGEMSFKANAGDIVTAIDLLIETHVREVISANLKGHNVVGEEFGGKTIPDVPNWYLDPIDGTTNFANRIPWTSFSLAMAINRKPMIGVVAQPWLGKVYFAIEGKGAFCDGVKISLENEKGVKLSSRVVSTELAAYMPWPGMIAMLNSLAERFCTMRIMGSGTLTLLSVAANQSVGSVISTFSPIDHLAAVLIVKEAGGVVLNQLGEADIFPTNGGVLCATPGVAQELHEIWRTALDLEKGGK